MLFPLSLLVFTIYPFTNVWAVVVSRNLTLTVPSSPPAGKQIVDGNYQSYSIEFSYMLDYAGNLSNPNTFSSKLLQNLKDISGAYPIVRAGGTTQNRAVWVQNQTVALIQKFGSNPDQPSSLSIGPLWLESFKTFPKGIQYIFGLSFYDGDYGLQQTLLEAIPAVKELGSSLYAFEIGNEVDGWPGGSRRPANYTVQSYVDQWLMFAKAIGNATNTQGQPLFQAAAFEAPRHLGDTSLWNAESILRDGIAKTGLVKTISDHDYMGSNCPARTQIATLEANLLNHTHMTSIAYYHDYLGNYSVSQGTKYVLGETNSISCQGQLNVSDVFGAALWAVDYVLYMSSLNVSRLYFHAGTPYRYSAWQPIAIGDSPAHVKALYYSNLFTATAFAAGNKQVSVLVNETFFTAYAVYDAGVGREEEKRKGGGDKRLTGLVLVNLQLWNSTMDANKRPYTSVKLPKGCEGGKVRRLTSPGAETGDGMTFAGRSVALNGEYVGKEAVESIGGSEIKIAASEAILVSF
ncbi:hypothetical protein BGZ60DRAFT_508900 [Tricladium varicosporioides]|nr:hypothetical protein BGZ60DRAFT_508900 [Hymenoscyphus varicosporioides]